MLQCGLFAAVGSGTAVTMGYDPFKRSLRASREASLYAQGVGRQLWLALAFGVLVLGSSSAEAQSIIGRGDGVVTAFSGIKKEVATFDSDDVLRRLLSRFLIRIILTHDRHLSHKTRTT